MNCVNCGAAILSHEVCQCLKPQKRGRGRPKGSVKNLEPKFTTSVSLTRDQQVFFRRLGGVKWLRDQLAKAKEEHASNIQSGLVGSVAQHVGAP